MTLREKYIVFVDNDIIRKSDVIVLLEGDGLNRCARAIDLYREEMANKVIFSGGITDHNYGSVPFSDVYPVLIKAGIPPEAIIHERNSLNTREQAVEVIKLVNNNGWKKLLLVASHYHQYRAYLTFLKEILDTKSNILLFNAPERNLLWFEETGWGKRFGLLNQEFLRIKKYSYLGHTATFAEAIKYQIWKEKQI